MSLFITFCKLVQHRQPKELQFPVSNVAHLSTGLFWEGRGVPGIKLTILLLSARCCAAELYPRPLDKFFKLESKTVSVTS